MSIQENVSALDTCIKEYLWCLTDGKCKAGEHMQELVTALREYVGCSFAFLLTKDVSSDVYTFSAYSSEIEDIDFSGAEFPIGQHEAETLSKLLDHASLGVDRLSFLGDEFANPILYYGMVQNGEVWALAGVMDFDNQQHQWKDNERNAVARVGRALELTIGQDYLLLVNKKHTRCMDEQLKNEVEQRNLLEASLLEAEKTNKARQQFLIKMSHDIRIPMNAVIGFAGLASSHVQEYDRVRDYLNKITDSGKHMLRLFNEVLDITNIEEGRAQLDELPNSLPDIIHEVFNAVRGIAKAKQIKLVMETVDVVHEQIFCDRLRFNQVLLNLVSNAVKYTDNGGSVDVTIIEKKSNRAEYAYFEFRVKDNGIGMSPSFVAHIFDPFEKDENTIKNVLQGTGLSMAITKNIIDLMQGDIVINSTQGVGTEIIVDVGLRIQQGMHMKHSDAVLPVINGKKVLVLDNSLATCNSLVAILERFGCVAEWTLSPNEAVHWAKMAADKDATYDAYFIGWRMSEVNGVEIARQLRQFVAAKVPIFLIVDEDYADIEMDAREAGVSEFIMKPLFSSDVKAMVSRLMEETADSQDGGSSLHDDFIGRRILLAEDNKMNQEIAVTILEDAGFFVEVAENGEVAVDKVINHSRGHYDLILMDIKMPVMDGYEATRRIRAMSEKGKKDVPIIAMTADAFFEDRQLALQCGMNEHIAKPVDVDRLFGVLKSIIS
ncbi:MAG: response regulator [Anaerovibrio sp.]|uniref:response regulator n=1 Tax=Anaerovibrio sp. TaxID=1872532 RepID=UPI0025EE9147|nr:response regulator [Anaerovibrio sp.]MCR5175256.1 response regulator [Anaerovibrio sp.]